MTDTKSKVASANKEKVEDVVVEEDEDDVAAVAAVVEAAAKSAASGLAATLDDDGTPSGKRRFFPRVKHLLTPEWEFVSSF
jgi:hypothetical protein